MGGTTAGARNVISANGAMGVAIVGPSASGNRILGNYIGTDGNGGTFRQNTLLGNTADGVILNHAPHNTIGGTEPGAGNVISNNVLNGIAIQGSDAVRNMIQGNRIGTDATGMIAVRNFGDGVLIADSPDTTVGGSAVGAPNLISGNGANGVYIGDPAATGNQVLGNYIGTDVSGTQPLGNTENGVVVDSSNNTIGQPGAGNVISANRMDGVLLSGPAATGNQVLGNYIGAGVSGTQPLGNTANGVEVRSAPNNTIGQSGAGNVISANRDGVFLVGPAATGNQVLGNYIGTDVSGTHPLGNTANGVEVNSAPNNTIGQSGAENVISANRDGVFLVGPAATGNQVLGNYIGTDVSGTHPLGNTANGVEVNSAPNNTIGQSGAENVISANRDGVFLVGPTAMGNRVQGNYIGTDVTGTHPLGNLIHGVEVNSAPNNIIGGPGVGNIIGGNGGDGVRIEGSDNNVVQSNLIGLPSGAQDLGNLFGVWVLSSSGNLIGGAGVGNIVTGNGSSGVTIQGNDPNDPDHGNTLKGNSIYANKADGVLIDNSAGNLIGGTTDAERNVISCNRQEGVHIFGQGSHSNTAIGNRIGIDAAGNTAIGNILDGVLVENAPNNIIGSSGAGGANVISANGSNGVRISGAGSRGNNVLGNLIGTAGDGVHALGNTLDGIFLDSARATSSGERHPRTATSSRATAEMGSGSVPAR